MPFQILVDGGMSYPKFWPRSLLFAHFTHILIAYFTHILSAFYLSFCSHIQTLFHTHFQFYFISFIRLLKSREVSSFQTKFRQKSILKYLIFDSEGTILNFIIFIFTILCFYLFIIFTFLFSLNSFFLLVVFSFFFCFYFSPTLVHLIFVVQAQGHFCPSYPNLQL